MTVIQPEGYLAMPETGTGPGVLVLHAWWGLNPFCQDFCQRLARAGFVAFAPDLYHGHTATTIADAERLRGKLRPKQAHVDVHQALTYLRDIAIRNEL